MWRDRILEILSPVMVLAFIACLSTHAFKLYLAIPNQKNPFTVVLLGRAMNPLSISLLLVHPILALLLIYWITIQYGWKKKESGTKRKYMESERDRHAKNGKIILWSAISISLFAMVAGFIWYHRKWRFYFHVDATKPAWMDRSNRTDSFGHNEQIWKSNTQSIHNKQKVANCE